MSRLLGFCLCAVVLSASQSSGRTEYTLGGADGVPWLEALSLGTAGDYLVFDENGQQVTNTSVTTSPQETGADTLIDYSGTSMLPRFIDPSVNIALADLESEETKVFLPHIGGEVTVTYGGSGLSTYLCLFGAQHAPFNKVMLDGDPTTASLRIFRQDPDKAPGIALGNFFRPGVIFDLGADVPVNRIRFYPRLAREEDALLIESFSEPKPDPESLARSALPATSRDGSISAWATILSPLRVGRAVEHPASDG